MLRTRPYSENLLKNVYQFFVAIFLYLGPIISIEPLQNLDNWNWNHFSIWCPPKSSLISFEVSVFITHDAISWWEKPCNGLIISPIPILKQFCREKLQLNHVCETLLGWRNKNILPYSLDYKVCSIKSNRWKLNIASRARKGSRRQKEYKAQHEIKNPWV